MNAPESIYRDDYEDSSRHFTPVGYDALNDSIRQIREGNVNFCNDLIIMLIPYIERLANRASERFGVDVDEVQSTAHEVVLELVHSIPTSQIDSWSDLQMRMIKNLDRHLARSYDQTLTSLDEEVAIESETNDGGEERTRQMIPLHESLSTTKLNPLVVLSEHEDAARITSRIDAVLTTLTDREREILQLRIGLEDEPTPMGITEVGLIFRVTRDRVREIEARALRRLQLPVRSDRPRGILDDTGK